MEGFRVNLKTLLSNTAKLLKSKCVAGFGVMFVGRKSQTSMILTIQYYHTVWNKHLPTLVERFSLEFDVAFFMGNITLPMAPYAKCPHSLCHFYFVMPLWKRLIANYSMKKMVLVIAIKCLVHNLAAKFNIEAMYMHILL